MHGFPNTAPFSSLIVNHPATTAISTLSLHDALPIYRQRFARRKTLLVGAGMSAATVATALSRLCAEEPGTQVTWAVRDRKSTRLNSSHRCISYAVFCLEKKNKRHLERAIPGLGGRRA